MDHSDESTQPTDNVAGLDRDALAFEKRIFLNSRLGRTLTKWLIERHVLGSMGDIHPFARLTVRRDEILAGWVISGTIGDTVYSLAVTDIEIEHSKLV